MVREESLTKLKEALVRLETELQEKKKEIKKLLKELKNTRALLRTYEDRFGKRFTICPCCDGSGGHYWEGPEGEGGFEECPNCEGKGVIEIKSTNSKPF